MSRLLMAAASNDLGMFGQDPIWITIIKALGIFVMLLLMTLFVIWWERRVVSFMQHRIGPNRVGPQGIGQALMDGMKLLFKEEIIPETADRFVYWLAPIIVAIPAFMSWAVIPLGPTVNMFGVETPLQLTDFPASVLFVVAVASVGIYGVVLAGWSSGTTYALLGGLRSSAQMISYEIPMGLSFVAVFLYAGSASTSQIVESQSATWYCLLLFPSFLTYVTAMVGETNRAPFDLPEAESELVGGFHTEYSSFKFAMFFLAEYINMIGVSAIATTLFLGGWRAPWPISLWEGANQGYFPLIWFFGKIFIFIFLFVWLRGTLPRMRYDHFMKFGWKFLLPVSVGWILLVGIARGLSNEYTWNIQDSLRTLGIPLAVLILVTGLAEEVLARRKAAQAEAKQDEPVAFDPFAGGHPVPPMPGQKLPNSNALTEQES